MKIRHLIVEISANGARNTKVSEAVRDVVTIGRGSACEVRLQSRLVSLAHATLTTMGDDLVVEEGRSAGELQVNGKLVQRASLRDGDRLTVGDVGLRLKDEGGTWVFEEERRLDEQVDPEEFVAAGLGALEVRRRLPSYSAIATVLSILAIAGCMLFPAVSEDKAAWNSGPISSSHHLIAADCSACHDGAFTRVSDEKCTGCHQMTEHADVFKTHLKGLEGRCASCHMEHNGDHGLIASESKLCTSCHASIKSVYAESVRPDVVSWRDHPEFSVRLQSDDPEQPGPWVRLDEKEKLIDNSHIKLNHAVHLKPDLRTRDGTKTLQCRDCHMPSADLRTIEPISMERHCQECHSLEFDDRLPKVEVPHGDPDVVYRYLYSEYAKLFLAAEDDPVLQERFEINVRQRPGGRAPSVQEQPQSREDFVRAFVERESRIAEAMLFTRTACRLCHDVKKLEFDDAELSGRGVSRFDIFKPMIPNQWMSEAVFSHGAHEEVACEDCHRGVRQSEQTADVLLPGKSLCIDCHSDDGHRGTVKSECVMCHSFHDQLLLPADRKRPIGEIVKAPARQ